MARCRRLCRACLCVLLLYWLAPGMRAVPTGGAVTGRPGSGNGEPASAAPHPQAAHAAAQPPAETQGVPTRSSTGARQQQPRQQGAVQGQSSGEVAVASSGEVKVKGSAKGKKDPPLVVWGSEPQRHGSAWPIPRDRPPPASWQGAVVLPIRRQPESDPFPSYDSGRRGPPGPTGPSGYTGETGARGACGAPGQLGRAGPASSCSKRRPGFTESIIILDDPGPLWRLESNATAAQCLAVENERFAGGICEASCNPVGDAGYLKLTEYASVPDGIEGLLGGTGGGTAVCSWAFIAEYRNGMLEPTDLSCELRLRTVCCEDSFDWVAWLEDDKREREQEAAAKYADYTRDRVCGCDGGDPDGCGRQDWWDAESNQPGYATRDQVI